MLASDAFFPFPDGVEEAAKQGVTAVIQPGGSVRDDEVIAAADRLDSRWCSPASGTSAIDHCRAAVVAAQSSGTAPCGSRIPLSRWRM